MGPMGLGIKISPAVFPVLAQSRAKETTQDGLMPSAGQMSHGLGYGGRKPAIDSCGEVLGVPA